MQPEPNQSDFGHKLGKVFWAAAWCIGLLGLTVFFTYHNERQDRPNAHLATSMETQTTTLQQNRQGHYITPCFINNYKTSCLLDTGATTVAISTATAKKIGLKRGPPVTISTANGQTQGHATWLESLQFGGIQLHDVRAIITPGLTEGEALLGMSALKHLKIVQEGRSLTLSQQ